MTEAEIQELTEIQEAERFLENSVVNSWGEPEKRQPLSNYASLAGHPCAFFHYAKRMYWEQIPETPRFLLGIFRNGRELQRAVKSDLLRAEWDVLRDNVKFREEKLDISGKVDFYLQHEDGPEFWRRPVPCEVKGVHPNFYDGCTSIDAMLEHSSMYCRMAPFQALLYGYLAPESRPHVGLVVRNKSNRQTRPLIMNVMERWDLLVQVDKVLTTANEAMAIGEPPEPIPFHPTWCERCDVAHLCPVMAQRETNGDLITVQDPGMDALANVWESTKAPKSENKKAWDSLKDHAKRWRRYDGEPGSIRTMVTDEWVFTVKNNRFKAERISTLEEG